MKKFILIDQSITGESGHYLVYAKSVLDCAASMGYEPVICINKRYCGSSMPQYRLYPSFTYTSLESLSSYRIQTDSSDRPSMQYFWGGVLKPAVQRVFRALLGKNYKKVRTLLFPSHKAINEELPEYTYKASHFAQEFIDLFNILEVKSDDIIFLPALSYVELMGLSKALHNAQLTNTPTIHTLFRWNPFAGIRMGYKAEIVDRQYIKKCFQSCEDLYDKGILRFYTDSDRLTEQYNQFSHCRFITIPIPHTYPMRDNSPQMGENCVLTYLGDARPEKGFQHLPYLVNNLSNDRIRFQIQANFNIPGGEAGIASCRRHLQRNRTVRLYTTPLSAETYADLLFHTDILLILYDWKQYYARSSGIFAEAMSAGIPALVPACTWMSMEVCKGRYKKLKHYITNYYKGEMALKFENSVVHLESAQQLSGKLIFVLQADWNSSGDSISVEIIVENDEDSSTDSIVDFLERVGNERCYLMFSVPENWKIKKIKLHGTYGQPLPEILSSQLIQLSADTPSSWKICEIFDRIEKCPAHIKSMINEYTSIQESTLDFSKAWRNFHNPQKLVQTLIESSRG